MGNNCKQYIGRFHSRRRENGELTLLDISCFVFPFLFFLFFCFSFSFFLFFFLFLFNHIAVCQCICNPKLHHIDRSLESEGCRFNLTPMYLNVFTEYLPMRQTDIRPTTVTGNTATIQWSKMAVQPGLQDYYKYELQYKVDGNMDWIDGPLISHDPSQASSVMHAQLTGLMANTNYQVKVKSYRVVAGVQNVTTETPPVSLRTLCTSMKHHLCWKEN